MSDDRIIPEVAHPTSVCPHPERWHCYDDMATEVEVLDALSALVSMLKPSVVLETGCYLGHGTAALTRGAISNGFGTIYTCDMDPAKVRSTYYRTSALRPADADVTIHALAVRGHDLIESTPAPIDFAFLDSGGDDVRCQELRLLHPKLAPGAVVAIHDTGIHTGLREFHLGPLLRELSMQHVYFDTPRGLALCRKMPEIYP